MIHASLHKSLGFPDRAVAKNPANTGDTRDEDQISGSGRSPGVRNSNQLQYLCLENFMDRGVQRAMAHGVTNSWT